mmetsp:Transcript_108069/g.287740  ORF Transcript_108069/g.287740 Transcript_108069/m.287740 type:complete len:232 (-) Transcript_108069:55-750(-)
MRFLNCSLSCLRLLMSFWKWLFPLMFESLPRKSLAVFFILSRSVEILLMSSWMVGPSASLSLANMPFFLWSLNMPLNIPRPRPPAPPAPPAEGSTASSLARSMTSPSMMSMIPENALPALSGSAFSACCELGRDVILTCSAMGATGFLASSAFGGSTASIFFMMSPMAGALIIGTPASALPPAPNMPRNLSLMPATFDLYLSTSAPAFGPSGVAPAPKMRSRRALALTGSA